LSFRLKGGIYKYRELSSKLDLDIIADFSQIEESTKSLEL